MKKPILFLLFSTISLITYSQTWSGATPGNIYYIGGNVGIGTNSPVSSMLQVGSVNANQPAGYFYNYSTGLSRGLIVEGGSGSTDFSSDFRNKTGTSLMYIRGDGNVGIGTSSPTEKLQVSGRILANYLGLSGNLGINSAGDSRIYMQNTTPVTGANWNLISDTDGSFSMGIYGNSPFQTIKANGNIGIGTTNPVCKLEINDSNGITPIAYFGSNGTSNAKGLYFSRPTVNTNPVNIQGTLSGIGATDISLQAEGGNVGIGTSNPQGYKLAVNGNMIAEEVKVKLHANWPDYVFKPNYKLPTLLEIKKYIDQNQHLPEMPTAEEVEKNGVNLGEMVKLQTKKIEELTLYLIEKDKQLAEEHKNNLMLQTQLSNQQIQVQTQRNQLDQLTQLIETLAKKIK